MNAYLSPHSGLPPLWLPAFASPRPFLGVRLTPAISSSQHHLAHSSDQERSEQKATPPSGSGLARACALSSPSISHQPNLRARAPPTTRSCSSPTHSCSPYHSLVLLTHPLVLPLPLARPPQPLVCAPPTTRSYSPYHSLVLSLPLVRAPQPLGRAPRPLARALPTTRSCSSPTRSYSLHHSLVLLAHSLVLPLPLGRAPRPLARTPPTTRSWSPYHSLVVPPPLARGPSTTRSWSSDHDLLAMPTL